MPSVCAVINCTNRSQRDRKSFFRLPGIPTKASETRKKLCALRRKRWLLALKRADLTEKKILYFRVCNDHFITGRPADIYDLDNPDWVPSIKMGYEKREICLCENYADEVKNCSNEKHMTALQRKSLLMGEEINVSASEAESSQNRTSILMENSLKQAIPFQESEILPSENSCASTHSRTTQVFKTVKRTLNKENTYVNLMKEQNLSSMKENFLYKNLVKNLLFIKKPNDFWGISLHKSSIICVRWSEDYNYEKRVIIENTLTVKVFLKEWKINLSELMNITCIHDISNLLRKIENYKCIK